MKKIVLLFLIPFLFQSCTSYLKLYSYKVDDFLVDKMNITDTNPKMFKEPNADYFVSFNLTNQGSSPIQINCNKMELRSEVKNYTSYSCACYQKKLREQIITLDPSTSVMISLDGFTIPKTEKLKEVYIPGVGSFPIPSAK